jgi:hypothetical protein
MASVSETVFNRDSWARWYAERHYKTDIGVDQVFYLPTNAPDREIRLLEINKMISEMNPLEPIDFGVDIGGVDAHTLFVLDVTPDQWEAINRKEICLPNGWTLLGMQTVPKR